MEINSLQFYDHYDRTVIRRKDEEAAVRKLTKCDKTAGEWMIVVGILVLLGRGG